MTTSKGPAASPQPDRTARDIGVGCFTFFIGGVSGAMTAVLLGKFYSAFSRAPSCMDMPLCDWYRWAFWGGIIGCVTLPVLVIMRLRRKDDRSDRAAGESSDTSNRG
ncbi:MAG: hypothetical protein ABJB74_13180 [Gemmatimonas sp.]